MRSRRNVKNTKRRSRNRKMTRRVKTKRGGMQAAAAARSKLGTIYYYDFLPLFTQFNTTFGKVLTPEQKAMVLKGERYYRSIADFPVDGPLKASITELQKEFSSTEKNAEKAVGLYNKILKTLEDAKKQQKENINPTPGRGRDTFSSPLSTSLARIALMSLRKEPFGYSPSSDNRPELTTPQKVSGYEKDPRSVFTPSTIQSLAPTLNEPQGGDLTVKHLSFDNEPSPDTTPLSSPLKSPPPVSSKSKSASRNPSSP